MKRMFRAIGRFFKSDEYSRPRSYQDDFRPRLGGRAIGPGDSGGVDFAREQVEAWEAPPPPEPADPRELPDQGGEEVS